MTWKSTWQFCMIRKWYSCWFLIMFPNRNRFLLCITYHLSHRQLSESPVQSFSSLSYSMRGVVLMFWQSKTYQNHILTTFSCHSVYRKILGKWNQRICNKKEKKINQVWCSCENRLLREQLYIEVNTDIYFTQPNDHLISNPSFPHRASAFKFISVLLALDTLLLKGNM